MGEESILHDLLCTENSGFLYEHEVEAVSNALTPISKSPTGADVQASGSKTGYEASSESSTVETQTHAVAKRKRNADKDRRRVQGEQDAYQHLRRIIPALKSAKKPTKLQTVRSACEYIETLQKTVLTLEGDLPTCFDPFDNA